MREYLAAEVEGAAGAEVDESVFGFLITGAIHNLRTLDRIPGRAAMGAPSISRCWHGCSAVPSDRPAEAEGGVGEGRQSGLEARPDDRPLLDQDRVHRGVSP